MAQSREVKRDHRIKPTTRRRDAPYDAGSTAERDNRHTLLRARLDERCNRTSACRHDDRVRRFIEFASAFSQNIRVALAGRVTDTILVARVQRVARRPRHRVRQGRASGKPNS